ncbi:hypothetical protein AK88_03105 [Plasmodium fragile]|uniref:RIIa domain-containing protein n=1 Tax=Plasmodium fragile TaxID=5857 RepID=A0A0D9QJK1_PLAFR|nr:uncharacterized protein AK88_03105 [Plasmodium fragile]KJP87189.1 hypothetical protein AK88_03105 [Plasmodium fragile]
MEEKDLNLIEKDKLDVETDKLKNENAKYMETHPELRDLLNDFISSALLHTPDDIFKYANEYFSYFKKKANEVAETCAVIMYLRKYH